MRRGPPEPSSQQDQSRGPSLDQGTRLECRGPSRCRTSSTCTRRSTSLRGSTPRPGDEGPPAVGEGGEDDKWLIIGTFESRTRSWKAIEEGHRLLQLIGLAPEECVPEDIPSTTPRFVKLRLSSYDRVTQAVADFRANQFWWAHQEDGQPILAARARSRAEQLRIALIGRAVRALRMFAEAEGAKWKLDSVYHSHLHVGRLVCQ